MVELRDLVEEYKTRFGIDLRPQYHKHLNFDNLDLKSKRIMRRFAEYITSSEGVTVEDLLQDFVQERSVKMKDHMKIV